VFPVRYGHIIIVSLSMQAYYLSKNCSLLQTVCHRVQWPETQVDCILLSVDVNIIFRFECSISSGYFQMFGLSINFNYHMIPHIVGL
jgi:hypothetical protein